MLGLVFNLGPTELFLILVILLLLFGARRLPELAKGLGQSIRAFKQGVAEGQLGDKRELTQANELNRKAEKAELNR